MPMAYVLCSAMSSNSWTYSNMDEALKMTNCPMRPTFLRICVVRYVFRALLVLYPKKCRISCLSLHLTILKVANKYIFYIDFRLFSIWVQNVHITPRPRKMFLFIARYRRANTKWAERKRDVHNKIQICWAVKHPSFRSGVFMLFFVLLLELFERRIRFENRFEENNNIFQIISLHTQHVQRIHTHTHKHKLLTTKSTLSIYFSIAHKRNRV